MIKKSNTLNCAVSDNKAKKLGFKILSGILSLGFVFSLGLMLTACSNEPQVQVENVSTLIEEYYTDTKTFLDNEVLEDVVKFSTGTYDSSKLLDATYDLGNGDSESLNFVKVIFTYKDGEESLYNINVMTFETGIELDKIANYDANKTELAQIADDATISTQYTTTYNSAENAQNDELAEAILENIVKSNENIVHFILKSTGKQEDVIDDVIYPFSKYDLIVQTDKAVKVYQVTIRTQVDIQDMIASLTDSRNYRLKSTNDIENIECTIEYKKYEKENTENNL